MSLETTRVRTVLFFSLFCRFWKGSSPKPVRWWLVESDEDTGGGWEARSNFGRDVAAVDMSNGLVREGDSDPCKS